MHEIAQAKERNDHKAIASLIIALMVFFAFLRPSRLSRASMLFGWNFDLILEQPLPGLRHAILIGRIGDKDTLIKLEAKDINGNLLPDQSICDSLLDAALVHWEPEDIAYAIDYVRDVPDNAERP